MIPGHWPNRAREAAFAEAEAKAQQYARLAGRALTDVVAMAENADQAQGWFAYGHRGAAREMMTGDGAGVGVEGGETTVRATVTVRWSLGARD